MLTCVPPGRPLIAITKIAITNISSIESLLNLLTKLNFLFTSDSSFSKNTSQKTTSFQNGKIKENTNIIPATKNLPSLSKLKIPPKIDIFTTSPSSGSIEETSPVNSPKEGSIFKQGANTPIANKKFKTKSMKN